MKYTVFYASKAEKYLLHLPFSKSQTILKRILFVASDPFKKDNNITKLEGTASGYRLRIGDIRVIYQIDTVNQAMYIVKIAPRGAIYS